jgi:hypothetical protein
MDPMERDLWEFPAPPFDGLLDLGTLLFIYESGVRIGIGKVIGNSDDSMLVEIEFTDRPRINILYYGMISDAAGLGGGA